MGLNIGQLNAGKRDGAVASAIDLVASAWRPKVILFQKPF